MVNPSGPSHANNARKTGSDDNMTPEQATSFLVNRKHCDEQDDIDSLITLNKVLRSLKSRLPARSVNNTEAEI